jgi:hypothetical protein
MKNGESRKGDQKLGAWKQEKILKNGAEENV